MLQLYKTLVAPHLTYASVIWSPYCHIHFKSLESVQYHLPRMLSVEAGQSINYRDHDYSPLITTYNLLSSRYIHIMTIYLLLKSDIVFSILQISTQYFLSEGFPIHFDNSVHWRRVIMLKSIFMVPLSRDCTDSGMPCPLESRTSHPLVSLKALFMNYCARSLFFAF